MSTKQAKAVEEALGGYLAVPLPPLLVKSARCQIAGITLNWDDVDAIEEALTGNYRHVAGDLLSKLRRAGMWTSRPTQKLFDFWENYQVEIAGALSASSDLQPEEVK